MDKLVAIVSRVPRSKPKLDDDFTDRLSHRYTVLILVTFAVAVSMHQFVGKPITCWAPKHFTGSHIKFATNYCWVKNTYYLPMESRIPKEHEPKHMIIYYQWVQFIMLFQAFLFYLPTVVWHGLNQKAGVDADDILKAAHTFQRAEKTDTRGRTLKFLVNNLHRFLSKRVSFRQGCAKQCLKASLSTLLGKNAGNYLCCLYILSKLLFLGNVVGQLFILNHILKTDYNVFGYQVVNSLMSDSPHWSNNSTFPRVSMCDFRIRRLGNVQRYTLQCVLPINLYTERMYAFLWFWMVFLAVITSLATAAWLLRCCFRTDRMRFLKNHLHGSKRMDSDTEKKLLADFLDNYLKQDGAFLLRMISHNTNNITVTEITCALWDHWRAARKVLPEDLDLVDSVEEGATDYPGADKGYPGGDKGYPALDLQPLGPDYRTPQPEYPSCPPAPGPPKYSPEGKTQPNNLHQ